MAHPGEFGRESVIGVLSEDEQTMLEVLQPVEASDAASFTPVSDRVYRPIDSIIDGPARERYERDYGADFLVRLPVIAVTWHEALAYCEGKTRATGREWRLPTEEERERAALGVDGRRFPWGELTDASLCKNRDAREEPSQPEPVGTFPTAASVYGLGDAAGNVWDWTSSLRAPERASELRALRGGSWGSPVGHARAANHHVVSFASRAPSFGFRPASSVTS